MAQRLARRVALGQQARRRHRDTVEAQVRRLLAVDQRQQLLVHARRAARHPEQHRVLVLARRDQPAGGRRAGQHHGLLALQHEAAFAVRIGVAAAIERCVAEVADAFLPGQRGQAAARDQFAEQRAGGRAVEPRQQQRHEAGHRQQRLRCHMLAGRAQHLGGAGQVEVEAARRFGGQHAGPAERHQMAPGLGAGGGCVAGAVLDECAAAADAAAAQEIVQRRFADRGE
jgi:hypothetical protein